mgnify:CR=1 FL=1
MEKELLKYLKSQRIMSFITSSSNKPWGATVYYTVDNKLNLYFISEPNTKHIKDTIKNKNVACVIASSSQRVTDKKIGVQLQGIVSEVRGVTKLKQILKMWNEANVGFKDVINYENIKKRVIKSKVYQVKPTNIKFFNEKLYGEEGTRTLSI